MNTMRKYDLTVNEIADEFLDSSRVLWAFTTAEKYQEMLKSRILPVLGDKKIKDIDLKELNKFLNDLYASEFSVSRIKGIIVVVNHLFEFALNHRYISYNPCRLLELKRRIRKKISILEDDDIRRLEKDFSDHQYLPLIMITLFLGLRISEALGLCWDRVDMENRTVIIDRQLLHYYDGQKTRSILVNYTKNRTVRKLPLCNKAFGYMEKLRNESSDCRYVFSDKKGNPVVYASFYYEFNKLMKQIGRDDVTPHSLRHTAATTLLFSSNDILMVKEFLGHCSIRTSKSYPTFTVREKEEIAIFIDQYFDRFVEECL